MLLLLIKLGEFIKIFSLYVIYHTIPKFLNWPKLCQAQLQLESSVEIELSLALIFISLPTHPDRKSSNSSGSEY